jgi:hypothetical protein
MILYFIGEKENGYETIVGQKNSRRALSVKKLRGKSIKKY